MESSPNLEPSVLQGNQDKRAPYQRPGIVYEGTIDIRAGSPLSLVPPLPPGDPFGDPFGIPLK